MLSCTKVIPQNIRVYTKTIHPNLIKIGIFFITYLSVFLITLKNINKTKKNEKSNFSIKSFSRDGFSFL